MLPDQLSIGPPSSPNETAPRAMHLSDHSLGRLDAAYVRNLDEERLRGLSLRLLEDLRSCWQMDEMRIHEDSQEMIAHALEVVRPFEHGHILRQILLMDTPEWP